MPTKAALYYTCNTHLPAIEAACAWQLYESRPLVDELGTVSLQPIVFGDWNIVLQGRKRSPESMHYQVYTGLQELTSDYVFLCESDVLYHPSHFDFVPPTADAYYYNENTYKIDWFTGKCVFYYTKQVSGCCASRLLLLEHYRKRIERIEKEGKFDRWWGWEPGCHHPPRGIDNYPAIRWMSEYPNVDIRHDKNITKTKWSLEEFRDKRTSEGWTFVEDIPGWGNAVQLMQHYRSINYAD